MPKQAYEYGFQPENHDAKVLDTTTKNKVWAILLLLAGVILKVVFGA
jgi:hypothetical protein